MKGLKLTFLGTGTSVGIPMVGCLCQTCQSTDPRDQRLRCSVLIETSQVKFVIDTGPDFRTQCLRAKIHHLDAAVYTHPHMDHIAGFDDLRRFCVGENDVIPIYAAASCLEVLKHMFNYAFNGQNRYRGYIKPEPHPIESTFRIGDVELTPLPVQHGKVETLGFLIHQLGGPSLAYLSDMKTLLPGTIALMQGIDTLIVDGLRHTPHPTHMNFSEAIELQQVLKPRETWLTHLQCEILHARDEVLLPQSIRLAYDGLQLHWHSVHTKDLD